MDGFSTVLLGLILNGTLLGLGLGGLGTKSFGPGLDNTYLDSGINHPACHLHQALILESKLIIYSSLPFIPLVGGSESTSNVFSYVLW